MASHSAAASKTAKATTRQNVWSDNERKAGYYFIEACSAMQRGESDTYYELLKRAAELNPDNSAINYHLGYCNLFLAPNDSARSEAFAMMKKHLDNNPLDVNEARRYAMLSAKLARYNQAIEAYENILKYFPANKDDRYALAQVLTLNKDYDKAIATYDSLEITEGIVQPISMQKVNLYLSLNDTTNALREVRRLYNTAPNSLTNNDIMGNVYQHVGMLDSAIVYFNRMDEIDPTDPSAALSKAAYYYMVRDYAKMDHEMYRALTNGNLPVDQKVKELTGYIRTLYQDRDSSERIMNLFNVIIDQHPHEAEVRRLYGVYLADKKQFAEAAEQFSYAVDTEPTNASDWKNLIIMYMATKNEEKATAAAVKSLEFNPDNEDLLSYVPMIFNATKQYDLAISTCDKALADADTLNVQLRSEILGAKADALYQRGDTVAAYDTYEQALALNPGNISVLNNYAYFLACAGKDLDKAEKMSALVVREEPDNSTYLDTYAWVFFKKHDLNLAKIYIEKAIDTGTEPSSEMFDHYGDILFFLGEPEKALEQWKKAAEIDPENKLLNKKISQKAYFYE